MNTQTEKIGMVVFILMIGLMALSLGGCSSSPSKQDIGMVSGAVVGGIVGSSIFPGSTVGTVSGAAAGGYVGSRIGKSLDRAERN